MIGIAAGWPESLSGPRSSKVAVMLDILAKQDLVAMYTPAKARASDRRRAPAPQQCDEPTALRPDDDAANGLGAVRLSEAKMLRGKAQERRPRSPADCRLSSPSAMLPISRIRSNVKRIRPARPGVW